MMRWILAALAAGALAGESKYTEDQLKARYYFDLGLATIDVSGYPKEQQENYKIFVNQCSRCHTIARPINAPFTNKKDWKRYIARMHVHSKDLHGAGFFKAEAQGILDFLVYDSKVRKLDAKEAFQAKDKELRALFADVQKERERVQIERDRKKAKTTPMGPDVTPQP